MQKYKKIHKNQQKCVNKGMTFLSNNNKTTAARVRDVTAAAVTMVNRLLLSEKVFNVK